jgi:hypothetical protein
MRLRLTCTILSLAACVSAEPPPEIDEPCPADGSGGAPPVAVAPACYALDPSVYTASADVCEEAGTDLVPYACVGFDVLPRECVDPMRRIEPVGDETLACCCNSRLSDDCNFFR